MAVRPIRIYPDPILRAKAKAVTHLTSFHAKIIEDLLDTLRAQPGGIGIAAPQIGYAERIVIIDVSTKDASKHRRILIDPKIIETKGERVGREGCMSIPDFTANVRRASTISVRAKNEHFEDVEFESDGIEAVCIQHETDHLNGLLFFDRVSSFTRDIFRRKKYLR